MARNQLPEIDGSVAYQVYPNRLNGSAAVQPIPAALPEEKPEPKKQKAPNDKRRNSHIRRYNKRKHRTYEH